MRRIHCSYKWGCWRLHQLPGERVDLPADVQLRVHGIRDIILQCWDTDRLDVLCKLMHCLLNFEQGWDRREFSLHKWRHCWWNHGVMHLHFV